MRQLTLLLWLLLILPVRRGDAQGMVVRGKDILSHAPNPAVLAGTRVVRAGRADALGKTDSVRLRPEWSSPFRLGKAPRGTRPPGQRRTRTSTCRCG